MEAKVKSKRRAAGPAGEKNPFRRNGQNESPLSNSTTQSPKVGTDVFQQPQPAMSREADTK